MRTSLGHPRAGALLLCPLFATRTRVIAGKLAPCARGDFTHVKAMAVATGKVGQSGTRDGIPVPAQQTLGASSPTRA